MRTNGILLALSSLPSKYGIGSFGDESYEFIDLLNVAGIKIWQLLPLNPTGFGNSPYQSSSGKAIDPIYVSLDDLYLKGYISRPRKFNPLATKVEYDKVRNLKNKYLQRAFKKQNDTETQEFKNFLKENSWCEAYAKFSVLTDKNNGEPWYNWKENEKQAYYNGFNFKKFEKKILYYEWVQFILYKEFFDLVNYASKKNVKFMGDIPFYVGDNSSDVWASQDDFLLGEDGKPTFIAGCPPDFFSKTGQRWGNPIYDWEYMKSDNFTFWIERIKFAAKLFSYVRIDHFRAFDTYYEIPASCQTAEIGEWKNGYGSEILSMVQDLNLDSEIVAEDLGDLFPSVLVLRDKFNLKGMNIVEFNITNPIFKVSQNQIIYTGTHDNDTIVGWYKSLTKEEKEQVKIILRMNGITQKKTNRKFIEFAFKNIADYAIIPLVDYLGLGSECRMNVPGTLGGNNWAFKLKDFKDFKKEIPYIQSIIKKYNR